MSFKGILEILFLNGKKILHHFWNIAGHCLVSPSKLEVSFLKIFKFFFQNAFVLKDTSVIFNFTFH